MVSAVLSFGERRTFGSGSSPIGWSAPSFCLAPFSDRTQAQPAGTHAVLILIYLTFNLPNPGFVAPKLLWLRRHEPEVIRQADCLLLPKDYVRLRLTGERATKPTDAGGTHLMETRNGQWAPDLAELAGVDVRWLPPVRAAADPGGYLLTDLANRWGLPDKTVVAMGAGDNMAGSIGVGVGHPGDAAISAGTSAVMSIVDDRYRPLPDKAVITHSHAVPGTFLSMGVVLSATSCLDWAAALTGRSAPLWPGERRRH
jgi:xylulokinase